MRLPRPLAIVVPAMVSLVIGQSPPLLQHSTLGNVTDIVDSNLDLEVRNTYEIEPADLDGDGDLDLVLCHFYLFDKPLHTAHLYTPIAGTGGIRIYKNMTVNLGLMPGPFVGPPYPDGNPAYHYDHMAGGFTDESGLVDWGSNGVPPSVRDAEVADLNGDGRVDIVLACGVGVGTGNIAMPSGAPAWWHIAQDRILIQQVNGTFRDETFGADAAPGGTLVNLDRLPQAIENTGAVAVGDLNGDLLPDIVFAAYGDNFTGDDNVVLLNSPTSPGHFTAMTPNPFVAGKPIGGASLDVELYDLEPDGDLDIVVANGNPLSEPVMNTGVTPWVLQGAAAAVRREEIWLNNGSAAFTLVPATGATPGVQGLPDPPGLPQANLPWPYNRAGFWSDTRSVSVGDIDNDGDGDILFANNGWNGDRPDQKSHPLGGEVQGQAPQLLLNMGNLQSGQGPAGSGLNTFLDVAAFSLPWGMDPAAGGLDGGWRAFLDFELTPRHATDVGGPADLIQTPPFALLRPVPDGYPDLLVGVGPWATNDVWINSGDWGTVRMVNATTWACSGRFFKGDTPLHANWSTGPATPWWVQQSTVLPAPFSFLMISSDAYTGLGINQSDKLYTHDIDWGDLDGDGWLDLVTADGDPTRGEINGVYFFRGMERGFRWRGPSDDGAVLPYVNTVLAYGVRSFDLDNDDDMDILVAGDPTALLLENQGGAQNGREGQFKERTFHDTGGALPGLLPFTGKNPLYAPILTESAEPFDADGDDLPEILFGGYPPYDSLGAQFGAGGTNDAAHWHLGDTGYHDPVTDLGAPTPLPVYCNFYVKQTAPGVFEDVTLATDPATGIPWLDRNGRIYENVIDRIAAADLDNSGSLDLVATNRPAGIGIHPHLAVGPNPTTQANADPNLWQLGLSLWMNDGRGHLKDEGVERLGPYTNPTDATNVWNLIRYEQSEAIAFGDVDDDGDIDFFTGTNQGNVSPPGNGLNRLWINMGGAQMSLPGSTHATWRTGEFRLANAPGSPLAAWGGVLGPVNATPVHNTGSIEPCDLNGDDHVDFLMTGKHLRAGQAAIHAAILVNNGNGTFQVDGFGGMVVDPVINGAGTVESEPFTGLVAGDYDGDGDTDCVVTGGGANVHRLFENQSSGGQIAFEDTTSGGSPTGFNTATLQGISWVPGWSIGGVAEDYDGNGVVDLYVTNHARTTQDDLFLSSASIPVPSNPAITRLLPDSGVVTGGKLRILGVNLANVDTVWFEKGAVAVAVTVPPAQVSAREVEVTMPANVPFGTVRVSVGMASPLLRSSPLRGTHLDAAPDVDVVPIPGLPTLVVFKITDADGLLDLDWNGTLKLTLTNASGTQTWNAATLATGWWLSAVGNDVFVARFGNSGDHYEVEVGDLRAAFGHRVVQLP